MRILVGSLLVFGAGLFVGYQLGQRGADTPDRVERRDNTARHIAPAVPPPVIEPVEPAAVPLPQAPPEKPATEEVEDAEEKPNPMLAMMKQALPMMKMTAEQEARAEAGEIAKLLNLAPHRAKQLADAFAADAVRKIESFLIPMLEGSDVDPATLADLREPDGLVSVALERDLNTILSGNEIEDVRGYLRKKKEKEIDDQVESNVTELALPDLNEDQARRLREVLRAGIKDSGAKSDEPPNPADLRKKLSEEMDAATVVEKLDEQHRARREKLAVFLTPAQLERLDAHDAEQRKQAQLAADMFGGVFGFKVKTR